MKEPLYVTNTAALYQEHYALLYPSLYILPWRRKHELNIKNLRQVLNDLPSKAPTWLDLACGQAWHFSQLEGHARMVGVDLSVAQLSYARERLPNATFIQCDMARVDFPAASFDLVTNFWAGYCYLAEQSRIADVLRNVLRWIRRGGALYFEVLLARDLERFNQSNFAGKTGFTVVPRSPDYVDWEYDDAAGQHRMTSPPLDFFLDLLGPEFAAIEAKHDLGFMVHIIATGKK